MAQEIQTLQPQERLSLTTQPQNFVGAMTQLASTPTILGTIGATMAAGASQTYQKLRGIEAGKTPSGDLLPPITQADQSFVDGYSAQAQQTLSLQAQQLINQGQLELNKNYQLSNSSIQTYNQNMQQGLQQIIEQAPSTIRADLANQFSNQLQRDVFNLNNRLISQQKTQAKDNASVYQSRQLTAMSDTALSGGAGAATQTKQILDKTLNNINGNEASGLISPVEAESQREAAKQTYLNSLLSADAAQAKQTKTEAQFLNGLVQTPSEYQGMKVTPTQWDVARKQAFSYVQNLDQFTNRNQNLILSDALVKQQESGLTSSDIASLKEQLDPERFNTFYTSYLKSENSRISKTQEAQFAAANYTNPTVMAGLTTQQRNNAFDLQASNNYTRQQDLGQPISIQEAQYRAQAASPVPIPKYVNSLSASLNNPNPAIAAEAAATVSRFFDTGLGSVLGDTFSQNTRSNMMAHAISEFKQFGRGDDEAVALARQMFNQPKEKLEANQAIANEWARKVNTPAQISSWSKDFINNPNGAVIPNQPVLQNQMKQVYKDYLVAFNGDEQMATSYLEKGMARAYGVTKVNGRDEYVYMPIELAAGLDEYATPLVLNDIYEQTQKQFSNMKAIYDNPKSNLDFYYELKPRVNYDEYAKAKIDIAEMDKAFTIKGKTAVNNMKDNKDAKLPQGMLEKGNIDLNNRPIVKNPDGSISTVLSMSANFDGKEYLIPMVSDEGKILTEDQAIDYFKKTKKHLGVFNNPDSATKYAQQLHKEQEKQYVGTEQDFTTIKEISQMQDKRSARYREAQSQIQLFEAGNPIEIEQVYRNGERYSRFIEVVNNPFMSISTGENPTIGGYDIQMRDKDGVPVRLYGIFDQNYTYPAYVPNIKNIKDRYSSVAKLPGQPMISYDEQIKRMLSSENKPGQLARAFMAAPIR